MWWDFDGLLGEVRIGLEQACARGPVASVAVDSWAVDYGLLDADGRADRTRPRVSVTADERRDGRGRGPGWAASRSTGTTGIQFLPFNTINQLFSARETDEYRDATSLLMIPDLVNHALCGSDTAEVTNASTTQLLDVTRKAWSHELITALGLRRDVMPPLHEPGQRARYGARRRPNGGRCLGRGRGEPRHSERGRRHPATADRPAVYISCGTWSLVGCELAHAVTTPDALAANVTNELGRGGHGATAQERDRAVVARGVPARVGRRGIDTTAEELAAQAAHVPGGRSVVDPDDPRFAAPGDMPQRIAAACRESGQPEPASPAEFAVRSSTRSP